MQSHLIDPAFDGEFEHMCAEMAAVADHFKDVDVDKLCRDASQAQDLFERTAQSFGGVAEMKAAVERTFRDGASALNGLLRARGGHRPIQCTRALHVDVEVERPCAQRPIAGPAPSTSPDRSPATSEGLGQGGPERAASFRIERKIVFMEWGTEKFVGTRSRGLSLLAELLRNSGRPVDYRALDAAHPAAVSLSATAKADVPASGVTSNRKVKSARRGLRQKLKAMDLLRADIRAELADGGLDSERREGLESNQKKLTLGIAEAQAELQDLRQDKDEKNRKHRNKEAINSAVQKIKEQAPQLASHLEEALRELGCQGPVYDPPTHCSWVMG